MIYSDLVIIKTKNNVVEIFLPSYFFSNIFVFSLFKCNPHEISTEGVKGLQQ